VSRATRFGCKSWRECAEPVEIEAPAFPRPVDGVTVGTDGNWPATLASGESVAVTWTVQDGLGTFEKTAFITATSPARDRRPITVWQP